MKRRRPALRGTAAAVFITVVLWAASSPVLPKEPTWGDVLSEARSGGYQIITTIHLTPRCIEKYPAALIFNLDM
jgi:hypothetical protein